MTMTEPCPSCGSELTREVIETSTFLYGLVEPVPIQVTQPVIHCDACREGFTDYRGEAARSEALERYKRAFLTGGVQRSRRMIVVFGGRDFTNGDALDITLVQLHAEHRFTHLLNGGADGADMLADTWARLNGVQPVQCDALWNYYRSLNRARAAGTIRNGKMVELEPEFGLCCPGGKGTADMRAQFLHYMKQRPTVRLFQLHSSGKFDEVRP